MRIKGVFVSAILAAVLCVSGSVLAVLSGDGTQGTPYLIQSRADFDEFTNPANAVLYWASGKYTALMYNLDLSDTTYIQAVIAPDADNVTSGFQGTPFTGVFDGNSHTITNLTINQPTKDYIGLFGGVGSDGQIKNVGIESVHLIGHECVGGLVGDNDGGTVTSCYATGLVGGSGVGGLVGGNSGMIASCYATGSVSGTSQYDSCVGGLVGVNVEGTVISCYATGSVSAFDQYSCVGGLVGANFGGTLASCYTTGSVSGACKAGGMAGLNWGKVTACFWDMETSGLSGSSGGKGLTTEQMKTMSIYQNAGWADEDWVMNDGADYPRLSWENTGGVSIPLPQAIPLVGNGTAEYPYLISTAQEFALLSWYSDVLDKQFRLTANLDLNGIVIYPIGNLGPFTGLFDGMSYTLSNVVSNQPGSDYVSLFGTVDSGGKICNLGLENINIAGQHFVGGLVGLNTGSLNNCYVTGSVTGADEYVGGLVGQNLGTLTSCYATGSVSGTEYVGGLVGENYQGTLTACYATSLVNGDWGVGGLVGDDYDGTITFCFWDVEASGQVYSDGGEGKTTAEMMMLSTFTGAGWDFSGTDGDVADWMMLRPGEDSPRLAWQEVFAGDIAGLYGVDGDDLMEVVNHWLEQGCPSGCEQADMDGSGAVDLGDFVIFSGEWMEGS